MLATDGRYTTQAGAAGARTSSCSSTASVPPASSRGPARDGVRRLAFEAHDVTVEAHAALADDRRRAGAGAARATPSRRCGRSRTTTRSRCCARPARSATARCARRWTGIAPGHTEREVARRLEAAMLELGADGIAFETIVATGPNSAIPHHRPTDREIERGDLLKIDFGALYGGYHADMTRTVVVGARAGGLAARDLRPRRRGAAGRPARRCAVGADVRDVDAAARAVVVDGRLRRAVPARAGPRRRPGDPRGSADGAPRDAVDSLPARRSPSSPGSTSPAAAGSGSRTPWSWATARRSC